MLKFLQITYFLLSGTTLCAQQKYFPDQCIGTWEGMMQIHSKGKLVDSVKVRLTVAQTAALHTWTWRTDYISEKMPMTKDYKLILKDEAQKIYTVDENNGIELLEYQHDNKLYSVFEVQGYLLTSSYELRGNELIFEVTSGQKIKSETTSEVTNFTVNNVQRVKFIRKKQ